MPYKNYMEDAVVDEFEALKNKLNICKCDRCKEDIIAWTLNRLTPKYVVTDHGAVYTKVGLLKNQSKADITVQIMSAVKVIGKHPRH